MSVKIQKCRLCRKDKRLQNSHLIPKFIIDWIKKTSVTGKFRSAVSPNRRVQNFQTKPLLCETCENLFSKWEKYFAENIFKPVWSTFVSEIEYNENMQKFAVSLTWRLIIDNLSEENWPLIRHKKEVIKAERHFRRFLLGEIKDFTYEHHLLMLHYKGNALPLDNFQDTLDINWYFFRTCDGTIAQNKTKSFLFVLIPGFVIASPITNEVLKEMIGTKIEKSGTINFLNQNPDNDLKEFIANRYKVALSPILKISDKQKSIISEDHQKRKNRIQQSLAFQLLIRKEQSNKTNAEE